MKFRANRFVCGTKQYLIDMFIIWLAIIGSIIDVRMPEMSGIDLLTEIRRIDPHLPVIVMTGQDSVDNRARAEGLPVAAFLSKPFALSRMRELVGALTLGNAPTKARKGPSVVMYSHDTIGLGHMRRNSAIARELVERVPGLSVLMLVGCPAGMVFETHPGIDYGIAGLALLPMLKMLGLAPPGKFFEFILQKPALFRVGNVHVFEADIAAIGAAQNVIQLADPDPFETEHAADIDFLVFLSGKAMPIERQVFGRFAVAQAKRIKIGCKVTAHAVEPDQKHGANGIARRLFDSGGIHDLACRLRSFLDRYFHLRGIKSGCQILVRSCNRVQPAGIAP